VNEQEPERRTFTYDEAAAMLPEVRRITEKAHQRVDEIEQAVDAGRVPPEEARRQVDAVVTEWANGLLARGIEVKGLWLVDFDNGSGYYCWKYPEPGLHFYHSYEEGFGGRVRIQ
jgi:hypothetical protein